MTQSSDRCVRDGYEPTALEQMIADAVHAEGCDCDKHLSVRVLNSLSEHGYRVVPADSTVRTAEEE